MALFTSIEAVFHRDVPDSVVRLFTALGGSLVEEGDAELHICISIPGIAKDVCYVAAEWITDSAEHGILMDLRGYDPVLLQAGMISQLDAEHDERMDMSIATLQHRIERLDADALIQNHVSPASGSYLLKQQLKDSKQNESITVSNSPVRATRKTIRLSLPDLPKQSTLREVKVVASEEGAAGRILTVSPVLF